MIEAHELLKTQQMLRTRYFWQVSSDVWLADVFNATPPLIGLTEETYLAWWGPSPPMTPGLQATQLACAETVKALPFTPFGLRKGYGQSFSLVVRLP